jgi:hypothetical protein
MHVASHQFVAVPPRVETLFWRGRPGVFRRLRRWLNPLSVIGWYFVAMAFAGGAGFALVRHGLTHWVAK